MRILIAGATGFIGSHLAQALTVRGHSVLAAARSPLVRPFPGLTHVAVDFARDHSPGDWLPRLVDVDAVVNAVGIFQGSAARFEALHVHAPRALFEACVGAGVRRVIQISALGADADADTLYHRTKHEADRHLRTLPLDWTIVQPSLVYGPGGASARLFTTLASLPLIPLPGRGEQPVQPVYLADLGAALVHLVENEGWAGRTVAAVGPQPVSLADMLAPLHSAMGAGPAHFLPVPMPLVRAGAALAERTQGALFSRDALAMLARGSQGDASAMTALLKRAPRPVSAFIAPEYAPALRRQAQLGWLLPLLRLSLALVWLGSGIVSLGLYPVTQSYALLAGVGVTGWLAPLLLYSAALLDIALGIATLALRRRPALWWFQIGLIAVYTALLSLHLPEFWLHPFAPLLKNLPMLAILLALLVLERR